jgi:hypothetical protein
MAHIILLAIYKVVTARAIVNTKNHYSDRNYVAEREGANCRLHPLIHTFSTRKLNTKCGEYYEVA